MDRVTIYCDESNFTGSDLLNSTQPIFTYATVCISEDEASSILNKFLIKLPFQKTRGEVKSKIFSNNRAKQAGFELFKQLENNIKVSVVHKKFALACKFVETIIEPVIQSFNMHMYQTGLHIFIANFIYATHTEDQNLLHSFSEAVRKQDGHFFIKENSKHPIFGKFINHNKTKIIEEINMLRSDKWSLDMTLSSLHTLLCFWYEQEQKPIDVFYDPAKPIAENMSTLQSFIRKGSHEQLKYKLMGSDVVFSYDLYSIKEMNSIDSAGIMIADLVAGFLKIIVDRRIKTV